MSHLEQAQAIVGSLKGCTSSLIVSNAMSSLNDLLLLQKVECKKAHTLVNEAKDKEDQEKLTYRMIENVHDHVKRMRQELRSDSFSHGL